MLRLSPVLRAGLQLGLNCEREGRDAVECARSEGTMMGCFRTPSLERSADFGKTKRSKPLLKLLVRVNT